MTHHEMPAETALAVLEALGGRGARPCVGGGWGVDALLGEQTRVHSDLDLWLPAPDTEAAIAALVSVGIDRLFPWPGDRPWNFVVHDGGRLRVDVHFVEEVSPGELHYGGVRSGTVFPAVALEGRGHIAGAAVRCERADWAVRWHSGYPPRDVDRHDVPLLCDRFGLVPPETYR